MSLIVQIVASYDAATWWAFAGTAVLAGVAFAAVNQALVALFGGVGRWISALVGVLAVATGLISTVPGWLSSIGAAAPHGSRVRRADRRQAGSAVAALVVWGVLSLVATDARGHPPSDDLGQGGPRHRLTGLPRHCPLASAKTETSRGRPGASKV